MRSFDIRAAFLQGKPQSDRVLAIEPVSELVEALQLATDEVCRLEKGAYGLIDAPYQWFLAITEELLRLGFTQSPFDPCKFVYTIMKRGHLKGFLDYTLMMESAGEVNTLLTNWIFWKRSIPSEVKRYNNSPSLESR